MAHQDQENDHGVGQGHVHGPGCAHDHEHHEHAGPRPFVRDQPKTGRNDPCLCGSGKKFKKCCGVA